MFDLHHKVAAVTGAGSGIGAAIASVLARQGARCIVLDRNDSADATVATIRANGGDAEARLCDVSDPDAVARSFDEIHTTFGGLDILVNNAGIATSAPSTTRRLTISIACTR